MYLSIADIKRHLIIDHCDDDLYLADLESVAEDAVRRDLNLYSLKEIEDPTGMLPACVTQAMLLLVGTLYANRESVSYGQAHIVPHAYGYLLDLARNYVNKA